MRILGIAVAVLLATAGSSTAQDAGETALVSFGPGFDVDSVQANGMTVSQSGNALRLSNGMGIDWPGITLNAPQGTWNLSRRETVALDVANLGAGELTVHLRVDNSDSDGSANCNYGNITLAPGGSGTLRMAIVRRIVVPAGVTFPGMKTNPTLLQNTIDPSRVTKVLVFLATPQASHTFEISNLRAGGSYTGRDADPIDYASFHPFIDVYGQYKHREWERKIHSDGDLALRQQEENADLAHPAPSNWNAYGGWATGPALAATGHFYPAFRDGKWWLVDPSGRLFFSNGVTCVGMPGSTSIADRSTWFEGLPAAGNQFYDSATTYDFTRANRYRKYGPDGYAAHASIVHRRLRSWGLNTIGNWSDAGIYRNAHATPYVVGIHFGSTLLDTGQWGAWRDVFDPSFTANLRAGMEQQIGWSTGDAWCIGYFVDNELWWGGDTYLAESTLQCPSWQPAKQAFVADLQAKYGSISSLNAAWAAGHASWEAFAAYRGVPSSAGARTDLLTFNDRFVGQYFRICRDEIDRVAPDNLYLGCRFVWMWVESQKHVTRIAKQYCDVLSVNIYEPTPAAFTLPEAPDSPVIIGEFHVVSPDRTGMAYANGNLARNQEDRGRKYAQYVEGALNHPQIVGCHWFQYQDQPMTGRPADGENVQIGFVDITDTPVMGLVNAAREVGDLLYTTRGGAPAPEPEPQPVPNQAPTGAQDAFQGSITGTFAVASPGVLANDTDPDGNALTAVLVNNYITGLGNLTLNANGSFSVEITYGGFQDGDLIAFTYKAVDPSGAESTETTVLITLRAGQPAPNPTYTLTVNGGTGDGSYTAGTQVSIAASAAPQGQVFDRWTGDTAVLASATSATTTVTMPAANVTVTATYVTPTPVTYTLTVNSGTGDGSYAVGAQVSIAASAAPQGQVFDRWTGDTAALASATSATTTVTMPAANVTVTATYGNQPNPEPEPNEAPVGFTDQYEAPLGGVLTIDAPGVLSNDTDADGDALTAVLVNDYTAGLGNLTFHADGSFAFEPTYAYLADGDLAGFTYRAVDPSGAESSDTTVLITLRQTAEPEPPPQPDPEPEPEPDPTPEAGLPASASAPNPAEDGDSGTLCGGTIGCTTGLPGLWMFAGLALAFWPARRR